MTVFQLDAGHAGRQWKDMLIYKIFRDAEWRHFQIQGTTSGAPVDVQDGYIHFSTAEQAPETARKHFAAETDLILLAVESEQVTGLRWEPSRGGDLFPHLYADLDILNVIWYRPLPLGEEGHIFPEGFA